MCGFKEFPGTFLDDCDAKMNPNAEGFAGSWTSADKGGAFHYERIETCGDRLTAVTGNLVQGGNLFVVHDWPSMDGSMEGAATDWRVSTLPKCDKFSATGAYTELMFPTGGKFRCFQFKSRNPTSVITKCLTGEDELTWMIQFPGSPCRSVRKLRRTRKSYEEEQKANPGPKLSAESAVEFLNKRASFYKLIMKSDAARSTKVLAGEKLYKVELALRSRNKNMIMMMAQMEFQAQYIVCN